MMSRRLLAVTILIVAGLASGSPVRADGDVSQREDESRSILERISLYQERHGIRGELDSEQMLERARWGYQRWLETEYRRLVKGAPLLGPRLTQPSTVVPLTRRRYSVSSQRW